MRTLTWIVAILLVSSCIGCASPPPGGGWTRTDTGTVHVPSRKPATYPAPAPRQQHCRTGYEPDGHGGCQVSVEAVVEAEAMRMGIGMFRDVVREVGRGITRSMRGY